MAVSVAHVSVVTAHPVAVAHVSPVEHVSVTEESAVAHPVAGEPVKPSMNTTATIVHTTGSAPVASSSSDVNGWGLLLGAAIVVSIVIGLLKRK